MKMEEQQKPQMGEVQQSAIESLQKATSQIMPMDNEDWELVVPHLQTLHIKANHFLSEEGKTCRHIMFIINGAVRTYYTNDELFETCLLLNARNEFVVDYESFITGAPTSLSIQAIEDTEVILLPHDAVQHLYTTSFPWNTFGRKVADFIYLSCKRRTEELLLLSPEKRYLRLIERQADFFDKYPLKYIASYLGITPQSLSRIRARISR